MYRKIGVIKGDGIGPEIIEESIKVLDKICKKYSHEFEYVDILMGGASIDQFDSPLTQESIEVAKKCDAILLGAVGGDITNERWYKRPPSQRPEAGLLKIRKELDLYANLRPATLYKELKNACPIKESITEGELSFIVVRELTGGLYFGERNTYIKDGITTAFDTLTYNEEEIERIARCGFELARKRKKILCSVDKANVLDTSRLWREVINRVAKEYPDVVISHMLVDNCAMQLIKNPKQFDVILTENMFGDILSDEASMITGSIGMLPSASLSKGSIGMYEPSHGSAPDIAGKNIANPIATILSAAMLLRHSFNLEKEASLVENGIENVLSKGYRTIDIMSEGMTLVGTSEMGTLIAQEIEEHNYINV